MCVVYVFHVIMKKLSYENYYSKWSDIIWTCNFKKEYSIKYYIEGKKIKQYCDILLSQFFEEQLNVTNTMHKIN